MSCNRWSIIKAVCGHVLNSRALTALFNRLKDHSTSRAIDDAYPCGCWPVPDDWDPCPSSQRVHHSKSSGKEKVAAVQTRIPLNNPDLGHCRFQAMPIINRHQHETVPALGPHQPRRQPNIAWWAKAWSAQHNEGSQLVEGYLCRSPSIARKTISIASVSCVYQERRDYMSRPRDMLSVITR